MSIKVKLKLPGINKVMKSAPVKELVELTAYHMFEAAGDGFNALIVPHKWTPRAYIQTDDEVGRRRQAEEHVLERVVTRR